MKDLFFAKSINGELVFDNKRAISNYLESVKNKRLIVQIEKEYGIRSRNQNSWYWGIVLRTIANDTGHTEQELHDLFKRIFLPPKFKMILGREVKLPNETKSLDKIEFGEYIEKIRAEVSRLGIIIPEPNKN